VLGVWRQSEGWWSGVDLISDALPFGRLWYDTPDHAIGYAMHSSRSADAVIRVYDAAGNVIETHRHKGDFTGLQQVLRSCSFFADTFATGAEIGCKLQSNSR
jgi:hypothetical protein